MDTKNLNNEKIPMPKQDMSLFDIRYNQFIDETDTQELIENISIETLEAFLYMTAKYFHDCRLCKNV